MFVIRRAGPALLAVASLLVVATPAGADDVRVTGVGTWTRNPVPEEPPPGGIAVANAPEGPVTIAAVRLTGAAGHERVTLRLLRAGGATPLGASIQICPTRAAWSVETNGAFGDAPEAECDLATSALVAGPAGMWSADVAPLLEHSESLVLLPAREAPATFSVTFEAPTVSSTRGTPAGPQEPPPPAPGPQPSFDPLAGVAVPTPFVSSGPPDIAAVAPEPPPPPTAATPATPPQSGPRGAPASRDGGGSGRDLGQALRLTLLALGVGVASIPFFRLRDGEHVPALSPIVQWWRDRFAGGTG